MFANNVFVIYQPIVLITIRDVTGIFATQAVNKLQISLIGFVYFRDVRGIPKYQCLPGHEESILCWVTSRNVNSTRWFTYISMLSREALILYGNGETFLPKAKSAKAERLVYILCPLHHV